MKLTTAVLAALLAPATGAWKVGNDATGMTDPDVTTKCTRWANDITSDDSCKALQSEFDIDYLQLHEWNPSLLKDHCVLIEDWSYCVGSSSTTNTQAANIGTNAPTLHSTSTKSTTASAKATATTASSSSDSSSTATSTASTTTGSTSATQIGSAVGSTPIQGTTFAIAAFFLGVFTLL
ncbi:unnamed protein product [Penicillium glandicola]